MLKTIAFSAVALMLSLQFGYHFVAPLCIRTWRACRTNWLSWLLFPLASRKFRVGSYNCADSCVPDNDQGSHGYRIFIGVGWPLKFAWNACSLLVNGGIALVSHLMRHTAGYGSAAVDAFFAAPEKMRPHVARLLQRLARKPSRSVSVGKSDGPYRDGATRDDEAVLFQEEHRAETARTRLLQELAAKHSEVLRIRARREELVGRRRDVESSIAVSFGPTPRGFFKITITPD